MTAADALLTADERAELARWSIGCKLGDECPEEPGNCWGQTQVAAVESILAARLDALHAEPLPADHAAVVHAEKQGHENGWKAAGAALRDMRDELSRSRAECQHLNDRLDEAGDAIAAARAEQDALRDAITDGDAADAAVCQCGKRTENANGVCGPCCTVVADVNRPADAEALGKKYGVTPAAWERPTHTFTGKPAAVPDREGATEQLADAIAKVLRENGIVEHPTTPEQAEESIHSWRCGYPDIYGEPCTCFAGLRDELAAVIVAAGWTRP